MSNVIPHISTERTKYSDPAHLASCAKDDPNSQLDYLVWLFWDTSTTFMINSGMPTNADVEEWIKVFKKRKDADSAGVQKLIAECVDYITPYVEPEPGKKISLSK